MKITNRFSEHKIKILYWSLIIDLTKNIHTKSFKMWGNSNNCPSFREQNQDVHVTRSMWIFQLIARNAKTTWWLYKGMYSTIATTTVTQTPPTGNRLSWSDKCMARYMAYIYHLSISFISPVCKNRSFYFWTKNEW